MSLISGVCVWDGRPRLEHILADFEAYTRSSSVDGAGLVSPTPGVALLARVTPFDRESRRERQPLRFARESVLTWDGRLDNREDLLVSLHRALGKDTSDAAIVAAAYSFWGLNCLGRLIGDWSLALWDGELRRLVLARDYMGNRPLFYRDGPESIIWSTSLETLVDVCGLSDEVDDQYVAGRLLGGLPTDLTPFRNTRALQAGRVLIASINGDISVKRFFRFTPVMIRLADEREYSERLRDLLIEAVKVRLRTDRKVIAHLSGGWDSSSIVCVADALIKRGQVDAPGLHPLSYVPVDSPESSEEMFIQAIERWCDLRSERVQFTGWFSFAELLRMRRALPTFGGARLETCVASPDDNVLLTGDLGDVVMMRSGHHQLSVLEPLFSGRPGESCRLCFEQARIGGRPLLPYLIGLAHGAYVSNGRRLRLVRSRKKAHHFEGTDLSPRDGGGTSWITERLMSAVPEWRPMADISLDDFPITKRGFVTGLYGFQDWGARRDTDPALWRTCPYAHRPLVEFVLAVPALSLRGPVFHRAGMKRALRDLLPPSLLARTSKGNPETALARAEPAQAIQFNRERELLGPASEWEVSKRDYIQSDKLGAALNEVASGRALASAFLIECVRVEAWLRTLRVWRRTDALHPLVSTTGQASITGMR